MTLCSFPLGHYHMSSSSLWTSGQDSLLRLQDYTGENSSAWAADGCMWISKPAWPSLCRAIVAAGSLRWHSMGGNAPTMCTVARGAVRASVCRPASSRAVEAQLLAELVRHRRLVRAGVRR